LNEPISKSFPSFWSHSLINVIKANSQSRHKK